MGLIGTELCRLRVRSHFDVKDLLCSGNIPAASLFGAMSRNRAVMDYLVSLFHVLEVESESTWPGYGAHQIVARAMVGVLHSAQREYLAGSVFGLAGAGRLLAELYCVYLTAMLGHGADGYSMLGELIAGLPEWAWKYSAAQYVSASGMGLPASTLPVGVTVYADLRTLQWYGNEGMHIRGRLTREPTRFELEEVSDAILRVAACVGAWCRAAVSRGGQDADAGVGALDLYRSRM